MFGISILYATTRRGIPKHLHPLKYAEPRISETLDPRPSFGDATTGS